MRVILLLPIALAGSGCVAKTAFDLVTLPVRAAVAIVGEGIDAVTTTQAEVDRARGRELREEDQRRGREARDEQRRGRAGTGAEDKEGPKRR